MPPFFLFVFSFFYSIYIIGYDSNYSYSDLNKSLIPPMLPMRLVAS